MKLASKFTLALLPVTLTVLAVSAELSVGRELALFEANARRDHRLIGQTIGGAFATLWRTSGEARARELLQSANASESQVRMRWIRLDEPEEARRLDPSLISALMNGEAASRTEPGTDGAGLLLTYVPIHLDGAHIGVIELAESLLNQHAYAKTTIIHAIVTTAALLALGALLTGALGMLFIGRPIRSLVNQSRRIGAGDFSQQVKLDQRDEIGDLVREMNTMCLKLADANERINAETALRIATLEQLRQADRLSTVGKLASGIAHELGTPLNVVLGRAKMIEKEDLNGAPAAQLARIIVEQTARMTAIIRQLLDFARRRSPKKARVDLRTLALQTLDLLRPLAEARGVTLELLDASGRPIEGNVDDGQIQQVLTNLVVNGIQSMPEGGRVWMDIHTEKARPPTSLEGHNGPALSSVRIRVHDEGTGISPDVIGRIFEPFFTTKGIGEGTGLGLSVSYGIVREHSGWIQVESEPGQGSTFSVFLPKDDQ